MDFILFSLLNLFLEFDNLLLGGKLGHCKWTVWASCSGHSVQFLTPILSACVLFLLFSDFSEALHQQRWILDQYIVRINSRYIQFAPSLNFANRNSWRRGWKYLHENTISTDILYIYFFFYSICVFLFFLNIIFQLMYIFLSFFCFIYLFICVLLFCCCCLFCFVCLLLLGFFLLLFVLFFYFFFLFLWGFLFVCLGFFLFFGVFFCFLLLLVFLFFFLGGGKGGGI